MLCFKAEAAYTTQSLYEKQKQNINENHILLQILLVIIGQL